MVAHNGVEPFLKRYECFVWSRQISQKWSSQRILKSRPDRPKRPALPLSYAKLKLDVPVGTDPT